MDLLTSPFTLVTQLTRMRKYGVLGRYLPEFGKIVGRMQHDLFHIYTVDAHTMMVIRNMRQFRYRSTKNHSPIAYHCVHKIPKPELLYIALDFFMTLGKDAVATTQNWVRGCSSVLCSSQDQPSGHKSGRLVS